jgi:raffinose/stachyose/melibiose transport system substrate-binding protein
MPHLTHPANPVRRTSHRARILRYGAIAVAASMALAACSGSKPAASSTGEPTGRLSYWYAPTTADARGVADFLKFNTAPFQQKYPKVQLQAVQKNVNTLNQNIQVALAAGKGPDIVSASGISNVYPYAQAGYLEDLSATAKANDWSGQLLPWALASGKVDGKLVTVPQAYETLILYYNKTLFDKNGWKPPTSRQELEDLAAKMTATGVTPFAAGNADYPAGTEWLVSAFMNEVAGPAKVYDALTGKIDWTAPEFAQAINLLKEYFDKGWFGSSVKQYFSTTDAQKYSKFANGNAGMYISGTWEFVTLPSYFGKGNSNQFDWAPLPSLTEGVPAVYPLSIGNTLSVNAKTQNAHAAETYLNWQISDTKTMWSNVAATGSSPMPVNFKSSDIPSDVDPRFARVYTSMQTASNAGEVGYTTWTSWGGKADQYILDNTDKVLNGGLSTADYLKGMSTAFKDDKARNLIPTPFPTGKTAGR